jgi:hypothetical protein
MSRTGTLHSRVAFGRLEDSMRKLFLALVASLAFAVAACGQGGGGNNTPDPGATDPLGTPGMTDMMSPAPTDMMSPGETDMMSPGTSP